MAWSCHYATGCFVAFLGDAISYTEIRMKYEKTFGYPALELFHCLPISKSAVCQLHCLTPLFLLATSVENSEATWEKATKCNKLVHHRTSNFDHQSLIRFPLKYTNVHAWLASSTTSKRFWPNSFAMLWAFFLCWNYGTQWSISDFGSSWHITTIFHRA